MDTNVLFATLERFGVNLDEAMERFIDDRELYVDCLRLFLKDAYFNALSDALQAEDVPKAFEAAHTLKGVAGNLSVGPLYQTICDLVEQLRAGKRDRLNETYHLLLEQRHELLELVDQ